MSTTTKRAKQVSKAAKKLAKAKAPKAAKKKVAKKAAAKATKTKATKTKATKTKATKATKSSTKPRGKGKKKAKKRRVKGDPLLFAPLSEGERADALRIMTADRRLASMTAVGRYRIISVEPLVVKPPHEQAKHRLAHVVVYDYAADRSINAAIDLDKVNVAHLTSGPIQPMLAREEEAAAIAIALHSGEVAKELGLGDIPQAALHYWSTREADIPYRRRSAAVLFGQPGARPSQVAVVDLLDGEVVEVVPAEQW